MVRDGRIDTIVVAITDMQGRLDGQARPGPGVPRRRHRPRRPLLHVPPGHGHGDEHARGLRAHELGDRLRRLDRRAGLGHAPRPALAAERTALVLADAIDEETGEEIPVAPRTILKRQVASAAADAGFARQGRLGVRVLRPQGLVGGACAERGWPVPRPFGHYNEDYHLLQATKAEPLHRLLRNQMTEADVPIEFSKGEARQRPARGQHPLRPRPRVGRPERRLQARRQGDRLPQRLGHHLHGQARPPLDRLVRPPPHEPLGRRRRTCR